VLYLRLCGWLDTDEQGTEGVREMNNPVVKESLTTQSRLIDRLRMHLSRYWKEGDVAPQLTSIELMLIDEAANELAAAQAEIATLRVNAEKWRSYDISKNQAIQECGK
jgi:hypothetical protein